MACVKYLALMGILMRGQFRTLHMFMISDSDVYSVGAAYQIGISAISIITQKNSNGINQGITLISARTVLGL